MSVAPLSPLNPVLPVAPERSDHRAQNAGEGSFEQAFARVLAENGPEAAEKGKFLAEILRLQLLRGAVSLNLEEDGEGRDSLLSSLLPNLSLAGRNLDPYSTAAAPRHRPSDPEPDRPAGSLEAVVERASRRYQVAPELVKAVIRAESGFNPRAVSPAGAQGLMQLMPGTARDLGVTNAFDPEQNVMGGTRYLRQMLDRYDGNVEKALAAYNWGPGNLDRSDGSLPRETRQYVARIKGLLAREG